ncbi:unnamed protein product, partial [Closterium sp. Yama58-4]
AIGTLESKLTGTLDGLSWLSTLTNLQALIIQDNALTGKLSSLHILSHLENLQQLDLNTINNATGELPREIRYLTALTGL